MSESAARRDRRETRKAIGREAMKILEPFIKRLASLDLAVAQALKNQDAQIRALHQRIAALERPVEPTFESKLSLTPSDNVLTVENLQSAFSYPPFEAPDDVA